MVRGLLLVLWVLPVLLLRMLLVLVVLLVLWVLVVLVLRLLLVLVVLLVLWVLVVLLVLWMLMVLLVLWVRVAPLALLLVRLMLLLLLRRCLRLLPIVRVHGLRTKRAFWRKRTLLRWMRMLRLLMWELALWLSAAPGAIVSDTWLFWTLCGSPSRLLPLLLVLRLLLVRVPHPLLFLLAFFALGDRWLRRLLLLPPLGLCGLAVPLPRCASSLPGPRCVHHLLPLLLFLLVVCGRCRNPGSLLLLLRLGSIRRRPLAMWARGPLPSALVTGAARLSRLCRSVWRASLLLLMLRTLLWLVHLTLFPPPLSSRIPRSALSLRWSLLLLGCCIWILAFSLQPLLRLVRILRLDSLLLLLLRLLLS